MRPSGYTKLLITVPVGVECERSVNTSVITASYEVMKSESEFQDIIPVVVGI
jgi:hypothetical protein